MDNQANRSQSKPSSKPTLSPYQEGVKKALAKSGEQQTLEAIMNGVPPQHIEQQAGLSNPQDILNQLIQLSQSQVSAKQEQGGALSSMVPQGILGGLISMSQGKAFNAPKMESLGLTNAIGLQNVVQQGQKFPLEIEKLKGDIAQQPLQTKKIEQETDPEYQTNQAKKQAQAKGSFLTANDLFTKFESSVQPFVVQRDAYSRIKESGQAPSPAGDLALLYGYMKLLDPGSTVREGEFATAQNSGSVPQRVAAMYNKVASGKRLSIDQRNDFLDRAKRIYLSAESQYSKTRKEFTTLAIANQLDPNSLIRDLSMEETPQPKQTKTGSKQSSILTKLGLDPNKYEVVENG